MSVLARKGCSDVGAEAKTQRLCFMEEKYMMPINMVDDKGFINECFTTNILLE